jgi:hypothetical protein
MAEQNYANHRKIVPLFHFVTLPILAGNLVATTYYAIPGGGFDGFWRAAVALAMFFGALYGRVFALKAQDRVIRLEERLRLRELLTGDLKNRINDFTIPQLLGLRYASDAELPELAAAVMRDNIQKANDIKKMVKNWRADHARA